MRTAEFDAFGPWVYPVRRPDEIPPLFRDHPVDLDQAWLALKVPRDIERRNASPTMHLYDHLLVAGENGLTVLSRAGTGYTVREVEYGCLALVRADVDLLDGRLTLQPVVGAPIEVRYNGASHREIDKLVALLRFCARSASGPAPVVVPHRKDVDLAALRARDTGLVNATERLLSREPGSRVVGAHARRGVVPRHQTLRGRVSALFSPVTLQALSVVVDEHELHLVHRRTWEFRGYAAVTSLAQTDLRLAHLTSVSLTPHDLYRDVDLVRLGLGDCVLAIPVPRGSSSGTALGGLRAVVSA